MSSEVSICNLALGWIGGSLITSLSDSTVEGVLCNANYEEARDMTLESRNWTFAADRATLTPLSATPDFGYTYKFLLPSDCLKVRQVDSDTDLKEGEDWAKEGHYLLADVAKLYIRYTRKETDPNRFSAHFRHACAARIAANIAIPLSGSTDMMKLMEAKYIEWTEDGGAIDGQQGKNQPLRSQTLLQVR